MKSVHAPVRRVLLAYFIVLLVGCSQPNWAARTTAPSGAAGPVIVHTSLPQVAAWARSSIGQSIKALYPRTAHTCVGNLDSILTRYEGRLSGAQLFGWGWDQTLRRPVSDILIADQNGKIIGAGNSGFARPDVPASRPDIHSGLTGWRAIVGGRTGTVYAWGIVVQPRTVCPLGRIDL